MIHFLTKRQVIAMHDWLLNQYGGLAGVRDHGALDSIVARVENLSVYEQEKDLFVLAAAYLLAIARGHGLNDATKRTALMAALTFLSMNGITIKAPISFADYMAEAAQGLYAVGEVAIALSQLQ